MSIVNTLPLESNRQIKINFAGGDLSSDAGLLLIKEFVSKLGLDKLLGKAFKTNDSALFRYHTDQENLLQMIYMIITGYFEDDASDELTNDPVFKSVLEKDTHYHHEAEYGLQDNHSGIHPVSAAESQLLRYRNTVFHHEAGFLSDFRSFHHNRQTDDSHCFDNES